MAALKIASTIFRKIAVIKTYLSISLFKFPHDSTNMLFLSFFFFLWELKMESEHIKKMLQRLTKKYNLLIKNRGLGFEKANISNKIQCILHDIVAKDDIVDAFTSVFSHQQNLNSKSLIIRDRKFQYSYGISLTLMIL